MIDINNLLQEEGNKLKKMLFSILKNEKNQTIKEEKTPKNHNKNILSNTSIMLSIKNMKHINKSLNKNYKQFRKNTKNLRLKNRLKIKKLKFEKENDLTPKNINSNICMTPLHDIQKTFSFRNPKFQKE